MTESLQDLRILVVADDPLARAGLAMLLREQPCCQIVGLAASQSDLLADVQATEADVVLWDLGWNPAAGLERLASLADPTVASGRSGSLPPVLGLLPADTLDEGHAVQAWQAGARAILPRDADGETMLAALAAMARGLVVLDAALAGQLVATVQPGMDAKRGRPLAEDLTAREVQVLHLLAEGLPNKTIAQRLEISEHTVKFHVNAILGKLGAQSRTDAVVRATRLGVIVL